MSLNYCPKCRSELEHGAEADQVERLKCSNAQCDYVFWNNPTPVVAAIIETQGRVMLVHHVHWPKKMLGLVSGFLESCEHPDEAIKREITEETALQVDALEFIGLYTFAQQNQLIIAYAARCSGEITLNEELDRYKLIEHDNVVPWAFGTGPAVRDWLAQQRKDTV